MQVKLLRVLDDGEYTRLGDTTVKKVNVRILAATNRDLDEMRKAGQIREDFFFRIHVFAVTLPPLRDRKEDIPLLINHFLERYSDERPLPILQSDVIEMLYAYDWPGNVREFQNAIQRHLSGQPLNLRERATTANPPLHFPSSPEHQGNGQEFQHIMEEFERKLILSVLEQHRWNKSKTAATLGIPRRTLYRKMARYEIA
jgi:transcriptional regulator with PAS, ATPase and Fis domain